MKTDNSFQWKRGHKKRPLLMGKKEKAVDFEHILEMARLVAAHVRKNTHCFRQHFEILKGKEETEWQLHELDRWRTSPAFTEREKAALNLSESISLKQSKDISANILSESRRYFSLEEIISLTLAIVAINDWLDLHSTPDIRVLVVEDNPNDQELLQCQLSKIEIAKNVIFVPDAHRALALLEGFQNGSCNWKPIAVFLDIYLPGMSGIELLQRIRSIPDLEGLPVIVMTGSNKPEDIAECHRLKVVSYVQKPLTFGSFSKAIANIFHQIRKPRVSLQGMVE